MDILLTDKGILDEETLKKIASCFSKGKFEEISTSLITQSTLINVKENAYSLQILLSILVYCLLRQNRKDDAKNFLSFCKAEPNQTIFPLLFLRAKFYAFSDSLPISVAIYNEMLKRYESYLDKENKENIITVETYHSKFEYFGNFFNYLFAINNLDSKIKKIYFELKNALISLNFTEESYNLTSQLYAKYPDDIVVVFEAAKDSISQSNFEAYQEILGKMKKMRDEETNEKKKKIYDNYTMYAESLNLIALGNYQEVKNIYNKILMNSSNNPVIMNNSSLMNVYINNPKACYEDLKIIADVGKLNCYNNVIENNFNILSDIFGYQKYQGNMI